MGGWGNWHSRLPLFYFLHVEVGHAEEFAGLKLLGLLDVHAVPSSCPGLDKVADSLTTNPTGGHISNNFETANSERSSICSVGVVMRRHRSGNPMTSETTAP